MPKGFSPKLIQFGAAHLGECLKCKAGYSEILGFSKGVSKNCGKHNLSAIPQNIASEGSECASSRNYVVYKYIGLSWAHRSAEVRLVQKACPFTKFRPTNSGDLDNLFIDLATKNFAKITGVNKGQSVAWRIRAGDHQLGVVIIEWWMWHDDSRSQAVSDKHIDYSVQNILR